MAIVVCPLSRVRELVAVRSPARVVSLLDPEHGFPELGPAFAGRHLRLAFHDLNEPVPGATLVSYAQIADLMAFLDAWAEPGSLLVHCRAGLSRSTAVAFAAACRRRPAVPESTIARELLHAAPLSRPNRIVVAHSDRCLGRDGRMSAAIEEVFGGLPWPEVEEGVPFELA
jgi:predicted protein tyrosine phosphatase